MLQIPRCSSENTCAPHMEAQSMDADRSLLTECSAQTPAMDDGGRVPGKVSLAFETGGADNKAR